MTTNLDIANRLLWWLWTGDFPVDNGRRGCDTAVDGSNRPGVEAPRKDR